MDRLFQLGSREDFQNISQKIFCNLYYSKPISVSSHLEAEIIASAKQDLITIFSDCNFNLQSTLDVFHNKKWDQEKVEYFYNLMQKNKSEVFYAAFNHYNSNYCETVLNFDWLVKFVLGTSEFKKHKYPLLQLMLYTLNKNGKQNKIMYDTNKDALLKMINALEQIK